MGMPPPNLSAVASVALLAMTLYCIRRGSCCFEARNGGQLGRLAAAADDKLAVDFGVEPSQLDVSG